MTDLWYEGLAVGHAIGAATVGCGYLWLVRGSAIGAIGCGAGVGICLGTVLALLRSRSMK